MTADIFGAFEILIRLGGTIVFLYMLYQYHNTNLNMQKDIQATLHRIENELVYMNTIEEESEDDVNSV